MLACCESWLVAFVDEWRSSTKNRILGSDVRRGRSPSFKGVVAVGGMRANEIIADSSLEKPSGALRRQEVPRVSRQLAPAREAHIA